MYACYQEYSASDSMYTYFRSTSDLPEELEDAVHVHQTN